ncbi:LLM class flavin-dependent oxidoreductase, partial [Streptosporangium algeriense]
PASVVAAGGVPIVVAETDEAARKLLQAKPIRFLALHAGAASWRRHGVAHPFGERYRGLTELLPHLLTRDEVERAMAETPDELVSEQAIVGSPQTVLDGIRKLVDAGLRHPMLIPVSALAGPEAAGFTMETAVWLNSQLRSASPDGRAA